MRSATRSSPDGCVELVFNLGEAFEQRTSGAPIRQPRALLVGQMTTPTAVAPTGRIDVIGVRLRTSMTAAALGISLWNVRDALLPADAVLGSLYAGHAGGARRSPYAEAARVARLEDGLMSTRAAGEAGAGAGRRTRWP